MRWRNNVSSGTGTHDVLAVVMQTIQDQSDHQKERIEDTTLDCVPDQSSIKGVEPMVRSELCRVLGLFDSPDDESGDDDVCHERDGEQGGSNVLDSGDESGLAGRKVGEFPDRHRG